MSANELNEEEWLKTTIELDSAVFELAQDLETTSLQLKTTEDKYLKLENEFTTKETEWIVGNSTLRGKLRQIEEQKLRQKIEYEEKFKGKVLLKKSCGGIFLRYIECIKSNLLMGKPFLQNNSLVTHILSELLTSYLYTQ